MSRESPAALGVYLAAQGEVHVVVDGEVVTAVAKIESPVEVVAEGGKYDSAGVFFREREVPEGERERERHIGEHHIAGACHHIFLGPYLGLGQLEIEMRMLVVLAGGVFAVFHEESSILGALRLASGEVAVLLLGDDLGDVSPLGLEVILHGLRFIFARFILEHGGGGELPYGVEHACGVDGA